MNVDDALDVRMRLNGDRVEAALLANHHERRLEGRERLHVGVRAHVLVMLQHRQAVDVEDRGDRVLEPAVFPGRRGALLRFDRVSVDVVAREAVFRRDEISRDALRHEISRDGKRRIGGPCAAGRADADATHQFDAPADGQLVLSAHHLRRGEIDGIEARRAEAVDLYARHRVAKARGERPHARDVAARFADRIDATHHHVVYVGGIEMVAILDRLQSRRGQMECGCGMQRAVWFAAPAWRSHVVVDDGFGHRVSPCGSRAAMLLSALVIWVLMVLDGRNLLLRQPLLCANLGQA